MIAAYLLLSLLVLQSTAILVSDAELDGQALFDSFVAKFNRKYANEDETAYRRTVFFDNLKYINEHNANPAKTCTLGVNQFSDLTLDEFKGRFPAVTFPRPAIKTVFADRANPDLKLDVNWVKKGVVSEVKHQGSCGSCWAFAATAVVESTVAILKKKAPQQYSEQLIVDCRKTPDTNGCEGGTPTDAYEFMQVNGTTLSKNYPYIGKDGVCKQKKVPVVLKIKSHTLISTGMNSQMEKMLKVKPLSIAVCVTSPVFMHYESGIISKDCSVDEYNHIMSIMGAGTEGGVPYWLVRNSWGSMWGEDGYVRIMRSPDGGVGVCGISYYPEYIDYQVAS